MSNNDKRKKPLAQVFHSEIYGLREEKYAFLDGNSLGTIPWSKLEVSAPNYFFVKKDFAGSGVYESGVKIDEIFPLNSSGVKTHRDDFVIDFDKTVLQQRIARFYSKEMMVAEAAEKYGLKDNRDWQIEKAKRLGVFDEHKVSKILYRPFDERWIYYDSNVIDFDRRKVMSNITITKENLGLVTCRQQSSFDFQHVLISRNLVDMCTVSSQTKETGYVFPLYLYPEPTTQRNGEIPLAPFEKGGTGADQSPLYQRGFRGLHDENEHPHRTPNLNMAIVKEIEEKLGLRFVAEKGEIPLAPFEKGGTGMETAQSSLSQRGFRGLKINPEIVNIPFNPKLKERATQLRNNATPAEKKLWDEVLSQDRFEGLRFLRQKPIDNFIVDFYCSKLLLVIELDGESHDETQEYDEDRTAKLAEFGIRVIRYANDEVLKNIDGVYEDLLKKVEERGKELEEIPLAPFEKGGTGVPAAEGSNQSPLSQRGFRGFPPAFSPIDLLDYIYAVLHSPTYRETYKEFLKIDFPRVPYPTNPDTFWQLVTLGGELRQIHLLECPTVENYITQYPIDGDNTVTKTEYKDGNVYINPTQYFANVPETAWNFYIGGYQPAQKWLKDRKTRTLQFEDILHYQKIIVALTETARIMGEIDAVGVEE